MKSKEAFFSIDDVDLSEIAAAQKLDFIWFNDEFSRRQVFAHEFRAFLDFKDQLEMMNDGGNECPFSDLARQAGELQATFNNCLAVLRGRK